MRKSIEIKETLKGVDTGKGVSCIRSKEKIVNKLKVFDGTNMEPWGTLLLHENSWRLASSTRTKMIYVLRRINVPNTRAEKNLTVGSFSRRLSDQSQSKILVVLDINSGDSPGLVKATN